ncbi:hypothetical protein ACEWY4_013023 [Coilia grayii]|uniref:Uncharacterized protein n=1 Tax=Coilia grayii TaxID=363190 RepID=A0ABD1JV43_9TELE
MMGTILQDRATRNNPHNPSTKEKWTSKALWSSGAPTKQSKTVCTSGVPNGLHRESRIPVPEGYQPKRRGKPERPSLMDTPSIQMNQMKQMNPKMRPQVSFPWEMRDRPQKQASRSKNNTDMSHTGPGTEHCHVSHCPNRQSGLRRRDCSRERRPQCSDRAKQCDTSDSASDLSDTERDPESPAAPLTPPNLNLRAEVIDPAEFQRPHPAPSRRQCQFSRSYPDFLPPPFNAWSLQQLAVFLNTEGKGVPRPKPSDQLEKYLERLLKLEWNQIQTIRSESGDGDGACGSRSSTNSVRGAPRPTGRPRPRSTPSAKLSTPKSILQCQRAFPLALLSSITHPSLPVQLVGCACPHCRIRYPHCNGSCRTSNAYQHSTRLSPVMERRRRPAAVPKRSSSESRAHAHASVPTLPSHSYHDPGRMNGSSHLRRMQAAGNIRNPSLSPPRLRAPGSVFAPTEAGVGRGRDCGAAGAAGGEGGDTHGREGREVSQRRRAVSERRKAGPIAKQDLKVNGLAGTDHVVRSRDVASGRSTGRTKHVDFVT